MLPQFSAGDCAIPALLTTAQNFSAYYYLVTGGTPPGLLES
jgi:hypothetical protein